MSATDGKVPRMPQVTPWTAEQVAALTPDAASLASARKLARTGGWLECGVGGERPSVWGLCQGSGKTPYQTCVDLTEPAYKCSCPSRKFPCKHALALLLRWAEGGVSAAEVEPRWVAEWQAGRATRAAKRQERVAAPRTETQERAAKRRAESRTDRVTAGAAELHQWLTDQIRHGIAGMDRAGYAPFERIATRMVDAQAPGLAGMVRRLAGVPLAGEGWEGRMLAELSLLHMLTGAASRLEALPAELAATVRSRLGQTAAVEQVLATTPVRDSWQVIGVRDFIEERLSTRRAWLIGRDSGREALVLSFAAPGQTLATDLVLGTTIEADACFYPGSVPRAVLAARHGPARPCADAAPALTIAQALDRLAAALAADPWLGSWPMLVRGCLVPGEKWSLVDDSGSALPLYLPGGGCWGLVGAAGGEPATLAVEWGPAGVTPMAAFVRGAAVPA
jgi:SWIM zinc finger